MTAEEILKLTRELLEDTKEPYLWKPLELVTYLNRAQNDVFKETNLASDASTLEICQIKLLSGVAIYALDSRVLTIVSAQLASASKPLGIAFVDELDRWVLNWRAKTGTPSHYIPEAELSKVQVYPYFDAIGVVTGSGNISFDAATKKITKPSGLSVYSEGDSISISGTTNNNVVVTLAAVLDTELTVNETLVNETNTSAILRKVRDTMNLNVTRLPINQISLDNLNVSPELPFLYHDKLPDGIMKYAYLKQDTETYDPKASATHGVIFAGFIEDVKKELLKKTRRSGNTLGPRLGAI
jgi:hypothetical protein